LAKIIGIDLGTTNSCVAVLEGGEPIVIHNQEGGRTTPSMVSWNQHGDIVVGASAKRQAVTNPKNTIFGIKRLIGRRFRSREVSELARTMPYEIIEAPNGDAWVKVKELQLSPQEVSARTLEKMKRIAEEYLGEEVTEAIVTVPAYFDDVQRQATKDAGQIAGLKVRAILNEPTAAALAFGVHQQKDQRVAVFDLGGGTFDISILTIENGVFEVLATSGDTFLGGDDFDRKLIELLAGEFKKQHDVDLSADPVALQRLKEAAERAKIELSSALVTDVNLPFISVGAGGPLHLEREIKRSELESICKDLIARLDAPCQRALSDARLEPSDIDQVVLVGGMTRMPAVQEKVEQIFGKKPSKGVNPDEIVAVGAATQSGIMGGELQEVVLLDVTPHSLGIKVAGDKMAVLVPRNTTIPTRERKVFGTTEDDQDFVAIEVYQGESGLATANRMLGRFVLGDLPKRPAGHVRVEVSFTMDSDGILHVAATELTTGKATSIVIQASSGLSPSDVDRLSGQYARERTSVRVG
jgi:molecular chaperone DnaK